MKLNPVSLIQLVKDYPLLSRTKVCWLVETLHTNILHSVKVLHQKGYDARDHLPWVHFCMYGLIIVTGSCRSVVVHTNFKSFLNY